MVLTLEQRIEELDEDRLRHLLPKDALETDVGERVNELTHIVGKITNFF